MRQRRIHIFGDESSHNGNHKFLVYGTVSCERKNLPAILELIDTARKGRDIDEWKWSGKHHRDLYPGFVDAIFKCRDDLGLKYRCLIVNTRHARHAEYNNNDPDLGLEKYIFLHLLDYARKLRDDAIFHVQLDWRTKKYTGEVLKRSLNGRDRHEHGRPYQLFADVLDVDSKSSRLVQVADVLSGAVAWVANERYLAADSSAHKRNLAEYVARKADIPSIGAAKRLGIERGDLRSLIIGTPRDVIDTCGFAIWRLHLRKREEEEAKARSRAHLSAFPQTMSYAEVAERGYKVVFECPHCDRQHFDYLSLNRGFSKRLLKHKTKMPPCTLCGRGGVVSFKPVPPLNADASGSIRR